MATTTPEKKLQLEDTTECRSSAQYPTIQKAELSSKTREYHYDHSSMFDSASSQKGIQGTLQMNFLDAALLSRLDMPSFSGNLLDFPTFWSRYNALVHSKIDLSDATKFSLLKSCLRGQALQSIEGIPVTDEDYRTAVDILHQMYNNPSALRHLIYTELANLPQCDQEGKRLQEIYLKMLRLIRQYTSITPGSPEYGLGALLYNKLPRFVQSKIYDITGGQMSLTPNQLIDLLSDVVRKEVTLGQVGNSINSYCANNYNLRNSTTGDAERLKKPVPFSNVRQKSCPFCFETNHNAFQCRYFNTPDERRDRTHQNDLCFKCLRPDHRTKFCDRPPCNICNYHHHPSLCYHSKPPQNKTLSERDTNKIIQNNFAFPKNQTNEWSKRTNDIQSNSNRFLDGGKLKQARSPANLVNFSEDVTENSAKNESEEDGEPNQKSGLCYTATSSTTIETENNEEQKNNDEVLLMCTEIILVNPDDRSKRARTLAFLDSGSTHSYITTDVAENLKLNQVTEKDITLYTFGNEESRTVSSKQYNICILLPNDSLYPMKVQSLPILTKPLPLPSSLPSLSTELAQRFSIFSQTQRDRNSHRNGSLLAVGPLLRFPFFKSAEWTLPIAHEIREDYLWKENTDSCCKHGSEK
ncbi:peptidase family A16 [Ostertagia ostertagi]